jgi:hypothetical protein
MGTARPTILKTKCATVKPTVAAVGFYIGVLVF